MIRRQVIHTQHLADEDIRSINLECPSCGFEQAIDVGQAEARGAHECFNCGLWFQYEEDYEEVPE